MVRENKFVLYETAVQDPEGHVALYDRVFTELRRRTPISLREDFCGTFLLAKTWVEKGADRVAMGLDLDEAPLRDGRRRHWRPLAPSARRRLRVFRRDVRSVTSPKVDVVGAGNFSFWVFKTWEELVRYFVSVRRSLNKSGVFILETAGGAGMIESCKETASHKKNGDFWFRYIWRQRGFNPITHDLLCTISFALRDGRLMRDAFVYDWRVWTLPEIERALYEAGFSGVKHVWEGRSRNGNAIDAYRFARKGTNDHAWVSFVVGIR